MLKLSLRFMLSAALLVVSGSFARADTYSLTSHWHIGSASPDAFTANGTFTWDGTTFSNIVLSFVGSLPADVGTNNWTATANDGELLNSNKQLIIGNNVFDCSGGSCIGITFGSALHTGSALTLTGVSGFSQAPNSIFDSATLVDTSYSSAVPEPTSVLLLLTVLLVAVPLIGRKLRRVSPAIES